MSNGILVIQWESKTYFKKVHNKAVTLDKLTYITRNETDFVGNCGYFLDLQNTNIF